MMSVSFWGVRGSMPCPGPDTYVFGGNTACLEIRAGNQLVIIDSGTGIRPLGDKLLSGNYYKGPVNADIFITHTHWDHIMGFPMFAPLYIPETRLRIRGPVASDEDTLESIIGTQLSHKFWPVEKSELAANIVYDKISEGTIDLGSNLRVITKYLHHPLLCMGYRIEYQGKVIITAYDHEPYRNNSQKENEKLIDFFKDADILIHDTQFTQEEFEKHPGWGHCSYDLAIDAACRAGVKKLVFFHHDPNRTDKQLKAMEKKYRAQAAEKNKALQTVMAREGLTLQA